MTTQFDGVEDDDMRRYLQEQNQTQKSAVFDITYRAAIEKGKTPEQATAAATEAERRNVFGYRYKTDRNGEPIQDGVGAWPHHVTAQ